MKKVIGGLFLGILLCLASCTWYDRVENLNGYEAIPRIAADNIAGGGFGISFGNGNFDGSSFTTGSLYDSWVGFDGNGNPKFRQTELLLSKEGWIVGLSDLASSGNEYGIITSAWKLDTDESKGYFIKFNSDASTSELELWSGTSNVLIPPRLTYSPHSETYGAIWRAGDENLEYAKIEYAQIANDGSAAEFTIVAESSPGQRFWDPAIATMINQNEEAGVDYHGLVYNNISWTAETGGWIWFQLIDSSGNTVQLLNNDDELVDRLEVFNPNPNHAPEYQTYYNGRGQQIAYGEDNNQAQYFGVVWTANVADTIGDNDIFFWQISSINPGTGASQKLRQPIRITLSNDGEQLISPDIAWLPLDGVANGGLWAITYGVLTSGDPTPNIEYKCELLMPPSTIGDLQPLLLNPLEKLGTSNFNTSTISVATQPGKIGTVWVGSTPLATDSWIDFKSIDMNVTPGIKNIPEMAEIYHHIAATNDGFEVVWDTAVWPASGAAFNTGEIWLALGKIGVANSPDPKNSLPKINPHKTFSDNARCDGANDVAFGTVNDFLFPGNNTPVLGVVWETTKREMGENNDYNCWDLWGQGVSDGYFALMDTSGKFMYEPFLNITADYREPPSSARFNEPSIAFAPDVGWGISYDTQTRGVRFSLIKPDGSGFVTRNESPSTIFDMEITPEGGESSEIAWGDGVFGVTWHTYWHNWFQAVTREGVKVAPEEIDISTSSSNSSSGGDEPDMAFAFGPYTGGERAFGVVWYGQDCNGVCFTQVKVKGDGTIIKHENGPFLIVPNDTTAENKYPKIEWIQTPDGRDEWAVSYQDVDESASTVSALIKLITFETLSDDSADITITYSTTLNEGNPSYCNAGSDNFSMPNLAVSPYSQKVAVSWCQATYESAYQSDPPETWTDYAIIPASEMFSQNNTPGIENLHEMIEAYHHIAATNDGFEVVWDTAAAPANHYSFSDIGESWLVSGKIGVANSPDPKYTLPKISPHNRYTDDTRCDGANDVAFGTVNDFPYSNDHTPVLGVVWETTKREMGENTYNCGDLWDSGVSDGYFALMNASGNFTYEPLFDITADYREHPSSYPYPMRFNEPSIAFAPDVGWGITWDSGGIKFSLIKPDGSGFVTRSESPTTIFNIAVSIGGESSEIAWGNGVFGVTWHTCWYNWFQAVTTEGATVAPEEIDISTSSTNSNYGGDEPDIAFGPYTVGWGVFGAVWYGQNCDGICFTQVKVNANGTVVKQENGPFLLVANETTMEYQYPKIGWIKTSDESGESGVWVVSYQAVDESATTISAQTRLITFEPLSDESADITITYSTTLNEGNPSYCNVGSGNFSMPNLAVSPDNQKVAVTWCQASYESVYQSDLIETWTDYAIISVSEMFP